MLISTQQKVRTERFSGEWMNTFFAGGEEVRLHCRFDKDEQETYVSQRDWESLSVPARQQLLKVGVPFRFYRDEVGAPSTAKVPTPATPVAMAAVVAAKPTVSAKSGKVRRASKTPRYGRPYSWDGELTAFIVAELSGNSDYEVIEKKTGVVLRERSSGRHITRAEVLALRSRMGVVAVP